MYKRKFSFIALVFLSVVLCNFSTFNDALLKEGFESKKTPLMAKGYDVVEYFNNQAVKGNKKINTTHDGFMYYFSSQVNLAAFNKSPESYTPQYEGSCAYGMAVSQKKFRVNPKKFEIRDGKLYLFYHKFFYNSKKRWLKNPTELQEQGDSNWIDYKEESP